MLDLEQSPYREYVELLSRLRAGADRAPVAFRKVVDEERGTYDASELERARLAHIMSLFADQGDVELLRYLLDQEIAARRADSFQGAGDTLPILSLLLLDFAPPDPDDVWRFWQAKRANFDTFAGGYDVSFVFASSPHAEVVRVVESRGDERELELLEKYDVAEIVAGLDDWRERLAQWYPRSVEQLTDQDCEVWAELFGDLEAVERYGLQNAKTPEDRAYLYRRLGRPADAVAQWRVAVVGKESAWDKASLLQRTVSDAALVPMDALAEVEELDRLRAEVPSWNEVGLGRMATQSCYELAAALDDPAKGRRAFRIAERWRSDLSSFTLVGLEAAVAAAQKCGESDDVTELQAAADAERARIDQMLR